MVAAGLAPACLYVSFRDRSVSTAPYPGAAVRHPWIPTRVFEAQVPTLQRIGFGLLLFYLFIFYSRIFDWKLWYLHIPGIAFRLMLAMVVLSGAFVPAFRSRIGKFLTGFTALMVLSLVFSVWKGGSFPLVKSVWMTAFILFVAVAGLITSLDQLRRALYSVAFGTLLLCVLALGFGTTVYGRLFLPQGKFANPNDLAQALLIGIPFWWLVTRNVRAALPRILAYAAVAIVLFTLIKTGSRGALVAVTVGLVILFLRSSMGGKMRLVVAGFIGLLLIAALMPGTLLTRYQTLFDSREEVDGGEEAQSLESASASIESRKKLLLHSLQLTLRHPLLGVGPGMFSVAEDALARSQGARRGAWLETHNSYTQISSEVGIPALILYLAALLTGLRGTARIYRQARARAGLEQTANIALGLNFSLAMFMVTSLFASVAYHSMVTVLSGFTVALMRICETQVPVQSTVPISAPRPHLKQPRSRLARVMKAAVQPRSTSS